MKGKWTRVYGRRWDRFLVLQKGDVKGSYRVKVRSWLTWSLLWTPGVSPHLILSSSKFWRMHKNGGEQKPVVKQQPEGHSLLAISDKAVPVYE